MELKKFEEMFPRRKHFLRVERKEAF